LVNSMLMATALGHDDEATSLGRGELEVFVGAATGRTTDWHYDFQENFTIQISGTKQWNLQQSTVKHPLRACTPHYQSPDVVEQQTLAGRMAHTGFKFGKPQVGVNARGPVVTRETRPGDVLYFPSGMWHRVKVIEPGVSINISLMGTPYATVICQALHHMLLKEEYGRAPVFNRDVSFTDKYLTALLEKLPDIIQKLDDGCGALSILPDVRMEGPYPIESTENNSGINNDEEDDDDSDENDKNGDYDHGNDNERALSTNTIMKPPYTNILMPIDYELFYDGLMTSLSYRSLELSPLATIIHSRDLTDYYGTEDNGDDSDDSYIRENLYVIHIGFGSTESLESIIRLRICDSSDIIKTLATSTIDDVVWEKLFEEDQNRKLIGILLYHGCLIWRNRPDDPK
jgi:Cupin-like domain